MTYVLNMIRICPNNFSLWQSMTRQQTNEHMREVINHSTHTHLLNTIKSNPNTNSWKTLQEESSWQDRLWQPIFLKHFKQNSSRHLIVRQKYKRLHIINKNHVDKEREKTTHGEIGKTVITTSIYIYKKWVQGLLSQCKNNVYKK